MSELLRNLANRLERRQNPLYSCDVEKQKHYLYSLQEPRDNIERSYAQYKCQMWLKGRPLAFLINLASLPLLVGLLLRVNNCPEAGDGSAERCGTAVLAGAESLMDKIPDMLSDNYDSIVADSCQGSTLTREDRSYLMKVWRRYPFSWHFLLKGALKVRQYSAMVGVWHPDAIIACSEYSFTSSLLTDYLAGRNVDHINVMHGSKVFFIRDSFFRFSRCYVWDDSFVKLFEDLRAYPGQFLVAVPRALVFDGPVAAEPVVDMAYYLGGETSQQLERLSLVLEQVAASGRRIKVRPHPIYTDPQWLQKLPEAVCIEDPHKVALEDSVRSSKCAASLVSTVLIQAGLNGVPVVIDDVTDREKFIVLRGLRFLPFAREHLLLSDVLASSDDIEDLWREKIEKSC